MQIIDKKKWILENNQHLFKHLLDKSIPKFILGINEFTNNLIILFNSKEIRIDGIIDDFSKEVSYQDYDIKKMCNVHQKKSLIISCVIDCKLLTALDRLRNNGFNDILTYLDIFLFFPKDIEIPHHCNNNFLDIAENRREYNWLYDTLCDNKSKIVLQKIIDFRYNFFADALSEFKYDLDNQYFDDFVKFRENEVFVDCGGYDGDTTLKFIRINQDYKKIYYFEPAIFEYEKSITNLANYLNIIFFNKAVSRTNAVVKFNTTLKSSNKIDDAGDFLIYTVKLDDVLTEPVSYIKMDIEGAEYDALIGAKETIIKCRPKLAVCVYHDQSHFWKIPKLVLSFSDEYNVYLRHYTEGILETVMYFLPKG